MTSDLPLYFIAIIPPPSVAEELMLLKYEMRDLFGSKASLNSPPHITLHMPFKYKDSKLDQLIETLTGITFSLVEISLKSFGKFEPRVIFVDVEMNDSLSLLQKEVKKKCQRLGLGDSTYRNHGFHPHITIGFRDLKKRFFEEAWNYINAKTINYQFTIDSFFLLKHNGKTWEPFLEFKSN